MEKISVILRMNLFISATLFLGICDVTASDLSAIVISPVEKIAEGFQFTEGPVWYKDGTLLFSDIPANHIMQWKGKNQTTVWRADSGQSNGLTLDREGRLIACEHKNRRVTRTEKDGKITVIADRYQGKKLNSPNDCVVRSDGTIFFTDPPYGVSEAEKEQQVNGVYCVLPDNQPVLLASDFDRPNGLAFSPDEKVLYVADTTRNQVRIFRVEKENKIVENKSFPVEMPDGLKVDKQNRIFVAAKDGVDVFDSSGKLLGVISCPEQPANCAFGGQDYKTLFITARKGLYKVEVTVPGLPPGVNKSGVMK